MADTTIDLTVSPYYDRYDSSNNRTMVLFNVDRQLSASELNEMQSELHYAIKGVGDSVMSDGDKQSGMGYTQSGNSITVSEGDVYLGGMRRHFPEQTVSITGAGTETLGVKLIQSIITADDDPSLKNPAVGTDAYQSLGADRLQETVSLVANDSTAATIYTFKDGVLVNNNISTELSKVQELIANTSYDTNGSFRSGTNGFGLSTAQNASNTNKVDIIVDSGNAYVLGYPVKKKYPTRIAVDKSLTTATEQSEGNYYTTGTYKYNLSYPAVKSVDTVVAQVRKTVTMTRGATVGGTDTFPDSNVLTVEKVFTEGTSGVTYTAGTDYTNDHTSITWKASGSYPTAGTSYRVTYVYNKTLVLNTDYKVVTGTGDLAVTYIDFTGMGIVGSGDSTGGVLISNSLIQTTYEYYLYRKDLITIDKDGNLTVHTGTPANADTVAAPNLVDSTVLQIGYVELYPNSSNSSSNVYVTSNLTMSDLGKLKTRVDNIEYNEAINMLDKASYNATDPTSLRGVFSDGFISLDKADTTNPIWDAAMSFDDAELTLPYTAQVDVTPELDLTQSNLDTTSTLITAPFTETAVIKQTQATSTINVNPYDQAREGKLVLTPSSDNWIDTDNVTVTEDQYKTIYLDRWWQHGGYINSSDAEWYVQNATWNTANSSYSSSYVNGNWTEFTEGTNLGIQDLQGTVLSAGGTQTTESMEQYIRSRTLSFSATGLTPNATGFYITFYGITCPITAGSGYNAANSSGQVQVAADGSYQGTFVIPANVPCGTREVVFTNDADSAEAPYEAQGIKKTVEDIIFKTYVTAHFTDPLAQSFVPTTYYNMTSLGLYFASKSNTDSVKVQVRGMTSGFPNETIYGTAILSSSQVSVSSDASVETKVSFDDMIRLDSGTQYCIVILANSDDYSVYYAKQGETLIGNVGTLNQNAYTPGMMFESSNAYTWSEQQTSDLKFNIYAAQYNSSATILFKPMTVNLDSLLLLSTYLTPNNTGATWYYRAIYSSTASNTDITTLPWIALSNYTLVQANGLIKQLQLKATFDASMYSSPLLSTEDLSLGAFLHGLSGSYIGLNVDMTASPYNTLKVTYGQITPSTANVVPKYSTDGGTTWTAFTANPVTTTQGDWTGVSYTQTTATGDNTDNWSKQFKIRLDLSTSNSYERPRVKALQCIMTQE